MSLQRVDQWTESENNFLIKTVLEYVKAGKTQLQAFDYIAQELGRSNNAVSYKWNSSLRKDYEEEIKKAKKEIWATKKGKPEIKTPVEVQVIEVRKTVAVENLSVKEFKGQRVVTFKDIDEVHGRPNGTSSVNYHNNKKRFIEGEDYFKISFEESRTINFIERPNPNGIILLTESGYLMLVKSFTDDLAWEVQRSLVKTYFRVKQQNQLSLPQSYEEALEHLLIAVKKEKEAQKQIEVLSPKAERYEDLMNAENCQDMNQVAKAFKTGRNRLFTYLREQKVMLLDKALPYQKYIEKGYFIVIEVEKNNLVHTKTLVTPMGIDFIAKLLNENPPKQGFFDKVKALFTKNSPNAPTLGPTKNISY